VLALKNRAAQKFFTVLNILFTFRIFEQLALVLKNRVSLKFFTVLKTYFLLFRIFEQLGLALNIFTVLNILFIFRIFEQPALALKSRGGPENFHCIESTFYIQDL